MKQLWYELWTQASWIDSWTLIRQGSIALPRADFLTCKTEGILLPYKVLYSTNMSTDVNQELCKCLASLLNTLKK